MGHAARQDQRHLGFVEQDAVGLVEQRQTQAAHQGLGRHVPAESGRHPLQHRCAGHRLLVAQEVERQVLGRGVDDVVAIGGASVQVGAGLTQGGRTQAQRTEQGCHLGHITRGQVGVGGDHMHRYAGQRRHRGSQADGQRFAFARGHLGHVIVQQRSGGQALRLARRLAQHLGRQCTSHAQRLGQRFALQTNLA